MGADRCWITTEPLDPAALLSSVVAPSDGAVLLFWGVVRNHNDGRGVGHLEYETYTGMAEATLRQIVDEAKQQWALGEVAVAHRVGRLAIGDASVGIAVAAPHRAEVYEASRYIIEELKKRVPIWKREGYLEGDTQWLAGVDPRVPTLSAETGR